MPWIYQSFEIVATSELASSIVLRGMVSREPSLCASLSGINPTEDLKSKRPLNLFLFWYRSCI